MALSQGTWIAALGSLLVVVGIAAASIAGLLPAAPSPFHPSPPISSPDGLNASHPGGAFAVTFTESGLPNGTFWSVILHGQGGPWFGGASSGLWPPPGHPGFGWNSSRSDTIGFVVSNGTYEFVVLKAGNFTAEYSASPSSGNITVNGSAVSVSVSFAAMQFYTVNFSETGLPTGTLWTVRLSSDRYGDWNSSTNSTVSFSRTSGVYRFAIFPVWTSGGLYSATPDWGSMSVNGTAVTVSVTFSLVTFYNVTFVENGLPNGTTWSAGLLGPGWGSFAWNCTSNSTLTLTRPDGTYWFFVPSVRTASGVYVASPRVGNLTLNGTGVVVNLTFSLSNTSGWGPTTVRPYLGTNLTQSRAPQLARH